MSSVMVEAPALDFGRAARWMFASPKWLANLLWVALCSLLGVVLIGSFVIVGYQMEIIQRRSRGGQNEIVDFDVNRFMDYLVRGIIPAAIYFVISLCIGAVAGVLIGVWSALVGILSGGEPEGLSVLLLIGPIGIVSLVQIVFTFLCAMPLAMRAGLANDLTEGFKFKWALETAKFMWPTMLLCVVYMFVFGLISSLGLLLCFVGIFVTSAWLQLAAADLGAQLVDIYLYKGGQPVPIHGEAIQAEII